MIQTGFVRAVTQSGEGVNLALGIWGAGDVVGKGLSSVQPLTLECLTRVEAIPTEIDQLSQPTTVVLKHLYQAEELMLIRSYKRTDIMLLKLLSWLAARFGQDAKQGRLIDLRLTHQDLSELLGATRVTVTRALIQLEQQGFIQRLSLQRIVLQQAECWHYEI
jgi:CRP-like cAMP-binding protein